jgi:PAS domain S-box-containing protein
MKVEQRLKDSIKELDDLKAALDEHAIVAITDPQGKITCVNDKFCAISQYSREELLGQDHRIINSGYHPKEFMRDLWTTIKQGKVWRGEIKNKAKDGSFYWLDSTMVPFLNEDGTIRQYVSIHTVITKRKLAEAALLEREEQNRKIVEASPDGIFIQQQNRFVLVNAAAFKLLGASRCEELIGRDVFDFIHPDFHSIIRDRIVQAGQQEQPMPLLEIKFVRLDGSIVEVKTSSTRFQFQGRPALLVVMRDITEQRQAEEALNYERFLWQTMLDTSPDHIYFKDTQSRFIKSSKAQSEQFGLKSPDEMVGKTDFDFFNEAHARPAFEDEQEIIRTGQPIIAKKEQEVWNDGHVTWASSTKMPIQDKTGKIIGIMGISRDITENNQTEEALRNSEVRYRRLFESAKDGILILDAETGMVLDVNPFLVELLGLSSEAFRRKTVWELGFAKDIFANQNNFTELQKNEYIRYEDLAIETSDGRRIEVEFVSNAYQAGGKKVIQCNIRDITERKRAEESQIRLATAVEQASESIVITDTGGTILYVNPAFEKSTGYTSAEALGRNPRMLKSGKQDAGFYRQMWDVLKRGEVWHGHFINIRKDGKPYEEDATISPVRDSKGAVINYVAVKRDVTNEAHLEAQFRQLQKMESIGQLAGGVAHDFNNILTVIQIQSELLKTEGGLSPQQTALADEIGLSVQRATTLTRQLLMFGRKQPVQQNDLDLNQSINDMTKMLRRILGETVELQFKFVMQPLFVHADAGMLDQVLLNLAVNSRDAMPKGGRLLIETSAVEFDESVREQSAQARPGSFVCLNVSDTGCGIPPEILPNIFEPFFTTKETGKGTGLGLSTVFGIIRQHQGWINAYSEPGQGATFRIYLPRIAKTSGQKPEQPASTKWRGGNETILLVEDDMILRVSVLKTLLQLGYRVFDAVNGVEALKIWKQHRDEIHLLLTDMVMPGGINGRQLGERLLKQKPELKVIYASGYSAEVAGADFPLEEGVNFLNKPFHTLKLAQTLRRRLDS